MKDPVPHRVQGKVAVGLSGGVDSAVMALLLKDKGYGVVGVHLYCWPPKGEKKEPGCRADEDRKSALKTALELEIPFKVLDFSEKYKEKVIEYFYREYKAGRTPNPDVMCNSEIKFGMFLKWAIENDFDYVATGHYALLRSGRTSEGLTRLMVPKDRHKDQTYFLWKLGQKELKRVLFPLGDYLKSEVREIAKKAKLSVAGRPDSQGICFVGKINVRGFLEKRLKKKRGDVVDIKGNKIGEHDGAWFFTIGQRGGWRKGNFKLQIIPIEDRGCSTKVGTNYKYKHATPPLYVMEKNVERNELVVGESKDAKRKSFEAGELSWIGADGGRLRIKLRRAKVRIRHGGELIPVTVHGFNPQGGLNPCLGVGMEEGQRGVAAGQSAVFYVPRRSSKNEGGYECLGGGVIR